MDPRFFRKYSDLVTEAEQTVITEALSPENQAKIERAAVKIANAFKRDINQYAKDGEDVSNEIDTITAVAAGGLTKEYTSSDFIIDTINNASPMIYNVIMGQNSQGDEVDWERKIPGIKKAIDTAFSQAVKNISFAKPSKSNRNLDVNDYNTFKQIAKQHGFRLKNLPKIATWAYDKKGNTVGIWRPDTNSGIFTIKQSKVK